MFTNLILNTDSYKASHFLQYPTGTQVVSSYIESRGGQFPQTLFFGLQAFIKEYLLKPVTTADIDEAEALFAAHGVPFFRQGWEQIVQQHGGFLPIEIQALPEGMVVPTGNALVQIVAVKKLTIPNNTHQIFHTQGKFGGFVMFKHWYVDKHIGA